MNSFVTKVSAFVAGAILPLGLAMTTADAAVFDWSYTAPAPALGGAFLTGSGTLTTGAASGAGFLVDAITGTLNGSPVTGLLAPGAFEGNDNLVFPTSTSFIDTSGIGFEDAAGDKVNIFGFFEPGSVVTPGNDYGEFSSLGFGVGVFDLTTAAVPAPASLTLLAVGLLGLGLTRRAVKQNDAA